MKSFKLTNTNTHVVIKTVNLTIREKLTFNIAYATNGSPLRYL